jgi:hypothetical protein
MLRTVEARTITPTMNVLLAVGISLSLAILAISGVMCLTAIIGLLSLQLRSDADAARKFKRLGLIALGLLLISGVAFGWLSNGATIPLLRH